MAVAFDIATCLDGTSKVQRLFDDEYMSVDFIDGDIVQYTRSAWPFERLEMIEEHFRRIDAALAHLDTSSMGLLVDLRPATGRNDPGFEATLAKFRAQLTTRFKAQALVTKTFVGKLQVARYMGEDGVPARLFDSLDDAAAWLRSVL